MATSCEELTHWKRLWCWEGLGAGGEGDDRGWDGWMASLTRWTWVWVSSRSWWWTGRPGVLQSMGSQRVGHDWATELNWAACIKSFTKGTIHITSHALKKSRPYNSLEFSTSLKTNKQTKKSKLYLLERETAILCTYLLVFPSHYELLRSTIT